MVTELPAEGAGLHTSGWLCRRLQRVRPNLQLCALFRSVYHILPGLPVLSLSHQVLIDSCGGSGNDYHDIVRHDANLLQLTADILPDHLNEKKKTLKCEIQLHGHCKHF